MSNSIIPLSPQLQMDELKTRYNQRCHAKYLKPLPSHQMHHELLLEENIRQKCLDASANEVYIGWLSCSSPNYLGNTPYDKLIHGRVFAGEMVG